MKAAALMPVGVEHTDENILEAMKKLRYPVLVTRKRDGIRAINTRTGLRSQRLKSIPNLVLRQLALGVPLWYDMELCCDGMEYNDVQSIVMSEQHSDSWKIGFHILDVVQTNSYQCRMWNIQQLKVVNDSFLFEQPRVAQDAAELYSIFKVSEMNAWEGICFRTPDSPYKQGRSTLREQYLVKLSRYVRTYDERYRLYRT